METIHLTLMIDPSDAGEFDPYHPALSPAQRAALVRARLLAILEEENDVELATRLTIEHNRLAALARNAVREYRNDYHSPALEEAIERLASALD